MWLNDLYHALNPVAVQLGPIVIRWYGLAYLAGFLLGGVAIWRTSRRWGLDLTPDDVMSVVASIAVGIIVGARLGYVLFYGGGHYLKNPIEIPMLSEGGMSFHGGLVGAIVGGSLACWRLHLSIATMCDLAAIGAPIGLFFGRCANFVNGELWGKPTDLPWGVMFSDTGGGMVYRHPSQLYEAILEGLVIFLVLALLSRRVPARSQGTFIGVFLVLYGCLRFMVEFVRMPDEQLGYLAGTGWLTMGQCLSAPLVLLGAGILVTSHRMRCPQLGKLR